LRPILFHVFGQPVGSFGAMMAAGFLLATFVMWLRLREEGLDPTLWGTILLLVMLGGVGGAKLYFAVDTALRAGAPLLPLLHPRAGLTWYGGLVGGTLGAWLACRLHGLSLRTVSSCIVPGLALGQAVGRIGCFLAGDDYGPPTDLPFGVAFPEGAPPTTVPVHPTPLYESAALGLVFAALWRRRRASPFLWGDYLVLAGGVRFVVEFWRVNPAVALGLSAAQWIALGAVAAGIASLAWYRDRPPAP
jgi:phosphatidylglycerol:prolipoprotein diacylglycerol transferase